MLQDYRTALVTGGSSGIGRDIALALAGAGIKTVILGRDRARLEQVQALHPAAIYPVVCDVARYDQVRQAVRTALDVLQSVDILVNCAGVSMREPLKVGEIDPAEIDRIIDTNLKGVFYLCQEVLPAMAGAGRGYVINILSTAAYAAGAGASVYSASKFGARAVTEAIDAEYRHCGIRVSAVSPGPVDTAIWTHKKKQPDPALRQTFMRPETITQTVLYLLELPQDVIVVNILIKPISI